MDKLFTGHMNFKTQHKSFQIFSTLQAVLKLMDLPMGVRLIAAINLGMQH